MKKIKTKDGSFTFYNEEYEDIYHSVSGAIEEAKEKFVKTTNIPELAKQGNITLLDVCFGIGYNSMMAIHEARKMNPTCNIFIACLENDPEVIAQIPKMEFDNEYKESYAIIQEAQKAWEKKETFHHKGITMQLFLGDAREEIKKCKREFQAVFLDPFTPKRNPQLWTATFLKHIAQTMLPGAILATYSCARHVRENMQAAGLAVHEGPRVGRHAPSTFAIKQELRHHQ